MKRIICCFVFLFTINSCKAEKINLTAAGPDSTRYPVFANQFYPADSAKLTNQIKVFIENAKPPATDNAAAIIVPHAGYIYSGQIAADAFNQVKQI